MKNAALDYVLTMRAHQLGCGRLFAAKKPCEISLRKKARVEFKQARKVWRREGRNIKQEINIIAAECGWETQ